MSIFALAVALSLSQVSRPSVPSETEQRAPLDAATAEGFHFGLSAGAMGLYLLWYQVQLTAQTPLDWKWGRFGLRVAPTFRSTWSGTSGLGAMVTAPWYFSVTVENQARLYLGRVFGIGAGVETGAVIIPSERRVQFAIGPSVTPVLLRLGTRGQHQLSLTGSLMAVFPEMPFVLSPAPAFLNGQISYTVLF